MKNILITIIITLGVTILGLNMYTINKKKVPTNITNIKHFSFYCTNGYAMNATTRYEINIDENTNKCIATIKVNGVPEEEAIKSEIEGKQLLGLEYLLNKYNVSSWNGFHKSDNGVLDGDSFNLNITMENGKKIEASGYMMWPENYRNVKNELDAYFSGILQ